jgi:hypothetical protein
VELRPLNLRSVDVHSPVGRAALLLAVEGVVVAALGVAYGVAAVVGDPASRVGALLGAVLIVGWGVLLGVLGRLVSRVRRWARSPAVVVQLLGVLIGVQLAQLGLWLAAVPTLLLAGSVLYQLATPEARMAFRDAV